MTQVAAPLATQQRRDLRIGALIVLCLVTAVTLGLGYANKARCAGPDFNHWGRSQPAYTERAYNQVCYSDIQNLWLGRGINEHVFPYVSGGIDAGGDLFGGALEYPVLTGVLIWAGAYFVHTDAGFLAASALLLAPFGLIVAWCLGRLSGWRALLWALGPPLVLYSFHNWDLAAVACTTGAFLVMHKNSPNSRRSDSRRKGATYAAILLGVGFAVKIYPAMFVLPLALYVFTSRDRADVRGALRVVGTAATTAVLLNLPFALAGFPGWIASFQYQSNRRVDVSTNSIWYWGFPHSTSSPAFQDFVSIASPALILTSFAVAGWAGWRRYRNDGTYPWIAVSAAMLCGFLLFHKVHSPQYTLWLLPFFVLMRVRMGWVVAYLAADLAMGVSFFRWVYRGSIGVSTGIHDGLAAQGVVIGVWGRAALLAGLFVAFLSARSTVDSTAPQQKDSAKMALNSIDSGQAVTPGKRRLREAWMTRYVALLRAVNVGAKNRIRMADLLAAFVAAGYRDARTYAQTGNVIFSSPAAASELRTDLHTLLTDDLGLTVEVLLRTQDDLAQIINAYPFTSRDLDPAKVAVYFLADIPESDRIAELEPDRYRPEELIVLDREAFVYYPDGMGRATLTNSVLERKLAVTATARNWRVVRALTELSSGH